MQIYALVISEKANKIEHYDFWCIQCASQKKYHEENYRFLEMY